MIKIASISAIGIATSAHTVDHGSSWPYVSIQNFAEQAGNARASSGVLHVSINPIVEDSELNDWEKWIQLPENNAWM
jgi:hypothetical protein